MLARKGRQKPSYSSEVNLHEAFRSEWLAHRGWGWRWWWARRQGDCPAPLPRWSPVSHSSRAPAALFSSGWRPHSDLVTQTQRSHYSSVTQSSLWPGHTDAKVTLQQCKTVDCDMHTESKLTWQPSWGEGKAGVNCNHQSFKCSQLNGGRQIIIWCSCWVVLITVIPDLTCYRKHALSPILVTHPTHTHTHTRMHPNHPTINK